MKRGPKPKGSVKIEWSPEFAYAIGLLTADGCVSGDGRHIDFTSKDPDLVETFKHCLVIKKRTRVKYSGIGRQYRHVEFSDVLFREFLIGIGITPAKSKTIKSVQVPDEYFPDFLRGYFDGDGTSYSYYDPIFPRSYRFYVAFACASRPFLDWLRDSLFQKIGVKGHIDRYQNKECAALKYGKKEAQVICGYMYQREGSPRLMRKYLKIIQSLGIIQRSQAEARVETGTSAGVS